VLVGARLEVGLLGQGEGLDPGGRTAVVSLEGCRELTPPARDVATTGGPLLKEPCVDALDLADGAASVGGGTFGEPDSQPLGELGLEPGVVVLGGHDLGLEHHPAVEGEPLAPFVRQRLDLVGDHDVGVQVGVAGAGIAVVERGGDESGDRDPPDAALADAGDGDRPLEGYTIQRAAGRGGFGEVYYAVSDSGREVALKAVQGYEDIELRGISQCMNLKSPHLVTIFDVKHKAWVESGKVPDYKTDRMNELLDQSFALSHS